MAQARSFKDYVAHRFITNSSTPSRNSSVITRHQWVVRSVGAALLEDIDVEYVLPDDSPGSRIVFDVLV